MVKSNNKGFSLVEIIIAAAVFAILVYPITRALMMSVNTDNQSTKKQYAVEKAEEIMEDFKVVDLGTSVSVADIDKAGNRYTFGGTWSDPTKTTLQLPNGDVVGYTKITYKCDDSISLGTSFEKYDCTVELNDAAYQAMKKGYVLTGIKDGTTNDDGSVTPAIAECKLAESGGVDGYVNTGVSPSGTARNLDSKQAAIIATATYTGRGSMVEENNLDNQAYEYFKNQKAKLLPETWYSQYLSGSDFFSDDYFTKNTTIEVSKDGSKYVVKCIVNYTDTTKLTVIKDAYERSVDNNNIYKPISSYGDGVVFQQEFDTLPPIYLLYAPAICNGAYCPVDNITLDNKLTDDKDKVKIYLFQTASTTSDIDSSSSDIAKKYRQIICEQLGISSLKEITYTSSKTITGAKDIKIRTGVATGCNTSNMSVYANFKIDATGSGYTNVLSTDQDDSEEVYMYDVTVTLTDSKNNKTVVTGTRGK